MLLELQATFLRTALLLGLITPQRVIEWCDGVIHEESSPAPGFFALALTRPELTAVRDALRPLAMPTEPPSVVVALLGVIARDLQSGYRSPEDTVRVLIQFRKYVKLEREIAAEIASLEQQHMLAEAGLRPSLDEVHQSVREFLRSYNTIEAPVSIGR
jgi:hypothetical protein